MALMILYLGVMVGGVAPLVLVADGMADWVQLFCAALGCAARRTHVANGQMLFESYYESWWDGQPLQCSLPTVHLDSFALGVLTYTVSSVFVDLLNVCCFVCL